MKTIIKAKANHLKEEAEKLARALDQMRHTKEDLAMRDDRVYVCDTRLPGIPNTIFNGGARFDTQGNIRNLSLRQSNGSCATIELTVRNTRGRTSIVEKTYSDTSRKVTISSAIFNPKGQLVKYSERAI